MYQFIAVQIQGTCITKEDIENAQLFNTIIIGIGNGTNYRVQF